MPARSRAGDASVAGWRRACRPRGSGHAQAEGSSGRPSRTMAELSCAPFAASAAPTQPTTMQHFDEAAPRAPLGFAQLVPALRAAFAAEARVPPRHVHAIETAGADPGTVLIMPAWSDAGYLGIKTINI